MYKKKYKRGKVIKNIKKFVHLIYFGHYVFLNHKPLHPAFVKCMSFQMIVAYLAGGKWFEAIKIKGGN